MTDDLDPQQADADLERLDEKSEQLFQEGRLQSGLRIARESTRQAKSHQRVIHYMRGLFNQMRFGHGLLEPRIAADASVELVALLNDEEHARKVQPDLDEGEYEWVCSWMTSCAYDNLAEATGMMSGYNSEGMHECIADGLQVCRQTGKLECIKCFREYASDVYLAADDLEMVYYQCQSLLEYRGKEVDSKDRRWAGHKKRAWLELLAGRLASAQEELQQAETFVSAEDVYLKMQSRVHVLTAWDEVRLLSGVDRYDWSGSPPMTPWLPEEGEWPEYELDRARGDALALVMGGQLAEGTQLLTEWDQRLTRQECLKEWFEVRLRLIAAYRMQGKQTRAEQLARGLEAKAAEASDFLTMRRLKRLMDPAIPPIPIPLLGPLDRGPFAESTQVAVPATNDDDAAADDQDVKAAVNTEPSAEVGSSEEPETPLKSFIEGLMSRILVTRQKSDVQDELRTQLEEILTVDIDTIESPRDGAMLLHLSRYTITGPDDARRVWEYGQQLVDRFPQDATTLSVYADLGLHFHNVDAASFPEITLDELGRWFRKSLTLDAEKPRNFLRAGEYFHQVGNLGEAERCFARAFRLDRVDGTAALSLAGIYRDTDRQRDALAALDLALREGSQNADVAWEAALAAYGLEQYDSQLTYLDRHVELSEPHTWVEYYRAWALLELKRYDDCLAAIEAERQLEPPGELHLQLLQAAALAEQGDIEAASQVINELLQHRVADVDYLSLSGIMRNFGRVWQAISKWPADQPARVALEQRMLETGLMPDEYFEELRQQREELPDVNFYRVRLRQTVGDQWSQESGCLPGQEHWEFYQLEWGVLAQTEEEAVNRVLQMHHSGLPYPATVEEVQLAGEGYTDRPGVVWQGIRWCDDAPEDDDDGFFGMDFEDGEMDEYSDDEEE